VPVTGLAVRPVVAEIVALPAVAAVGSVMRAVSEPLALTSAGGRADNVPAESVKKRLTDVAPLKAPAGADTVTLLVPGGPEAGDTARLAAAAAVPVALGDALAVPVADGVSELMVGIGLGPVAVPVAETAAAAVGVLVAGGEPAVTVN
jgi:hypothetical protein